MIQPLLRLATGALLGAALSTLAIAHLPASAQTPAPAAPTASKPSPEELKKFASVVKQWLAIESDTETKMVQAIAQFGFSPARFMEIRTAKTQPNAKPAKPASPDEETKYNQAVTRLGEIQAEMEAKLNQLIQSEGLDINRFQQIFAAVQNDPKLREEVSKLVKG